MFCFDFFPSIYFPASREKCYKQIQAAIAKYREIKENINEGLKFYVTLQVRNCSVVALDWMVLVFILIEVTVQVYT